MNHSKKKKWCRQQDEENLGEKNVPNEVNSELDSDFEQCKKPKHRQRLLISKLTMSTGKSGEEEIKCVKSMKKPIA